MKLKQVTEIAHLFSEGKGLEDCQKMLEAIGFSSEEASEIMEAGMSAADGEGSEYDAILEEARKHL